MQTALGNGGSKAAGHLRCGGIDAGAVAASDDGRACQCSTGDLPGGMAVGEVCVTAPAVGHIFVGESPETRSYEAAAGV